MRKFLGETTYMTLANVAGKDVLVALSEDKSDMSLELIPERIVLLPPVAIEKVRGILENQTPLKGLTLRRDIHTKDLVEAIYDESKMAGLGLETEKDFYSDDFVTRIFNMNNWRKTSEGFVMNQVVLFWTKLHIINTKLRALESSEDSGEAFLKYIHRFNSLVDAFKRMFGLVKDSQIELIGPVVWDSINEYAYILYELEEVGDFFEIEELNIIKRFRKMLKEIYASMFP